MKDFEELRIRLRRSGTGRYLAVANGAARGAAVLHIGDEPRQLRAEYRHLVDIDLHRAGSGGKDVAAEMRELGRKTFDLVFGGPLGEVLQAARAAQGSGGLRLRFDLPPELADLPVETLCGPSGRPDQTFAFDANLSLVRTLPAALPQSRMPAAEDPTEPISILVAVARPEGLPEIGGDLEAARIENDLPHLTASATVLKSATRAKIGSWLEHQSGPAAVVLVAHGDYDERGGIGAVILEDEDGGPDLVSGDLLGGMLVEAPKLRLVVLDLCHSSRGGAAESFGGLAQAIIGRGVPAVVGMNGLVTDDVAATIGPSLLLDVCRNKTVDEAVLGARRRVAHNGRTAIEWGTPTLYVHEGVGHGWLFKVRGVKGGNAVDFLRHGRKAVEALVGGDGDFSPQQIIDAARYYRGERSWQLVKRTGEVNFENAELARLKEEAQLELDWAGIEKLCGGMAEDGKAASVTATMRALARRLPEDVGAVLKAEAKEYAALDGLMSKAAKAERDEDWEGADDLYGQALRMRPDGFRDAAARLAASREERTLAAAYAEAAAFEDAGEWLETERTFAAILTQRADGYRDSAARAAYATGRRREAEEDWGGAAEAYTTCGSEADAVDGRSGRSAADSSGRGGYRDSRRRADYCKGREAVAESQWDLAAERLAGLSVEDAEQWHRYAQGRTAEAAGQWEVAAEHFADLGSFADSADRCLLAEGHLALAAGDHQAAADRFSRVRHLDPPVDEVLASLYAAAEVAESAEDWARAAEAYGAAAGFEDAAARRDYCTARAAEADLLWAEAAASYRATDHRDAAARLPYAEGRAAEQAGDWDGARERYRSLPDPFGDSAGRADYAQGRAADARRDWEAVVAGFAGLPDRFDDGEVGRRRRYARAARAADGEEWTEVLAHLRHADDAEHDGDVGRLRLRAKGAQAEQTGDWAGAVAAYTEGGDEFAEALHYALLRRCEVDADWDGMLEAARHLPPGHRDVDTRGRHAEARQALARGDWDGALELLSELPSGFDGREHLILHARFGKADTEADWPAVAILADEIEAEGHTAICGGEVHIAVTGSGEDARGRQYLPTRRWYARGRMAERYAAWDAAAEAFRACGGHADALARVAHADGRRAEAQGRLSEAIALYDQADTLAAAYADGRESQRRESETTSLRGRAPAPAADGRRESQGSTSEATTPRDPADGRIAPQGRPREATALPNQADGRRESSGRGEATSLHDHTDGRRASSGRSEATAPYDHADVLAQAAARSRRLKTLLDALPWAETLATDSLVADPVAAADPGFPYTAFAAAGITPSSSAADVQNATFELMMVGGISEQALKSWDRLRLPDRRLLLDAQLYGFPDRPAFAAALADLDPEADPLAAICERLPDSAPLFRLLAGDRAAAVEAWKTRLTEAPGNMPDAHRLAVAALWHAIELEAGGAWEHAERLWRLSLACWAALLGDDEYWTVWSLGRAAHYGHAVLPGETSRLRADLGQHLMSILAAIAERHAREGRPGPAARSRALVSVLEAEMEAAQCLRDAGGLPLPGEGRIACGPGYLALTGLRPGLARFVAAAEADADLGDAALRRLRWSFSGFGRAFADYERHRYSAALRRLPDPRALRERPEDCDGPAPGHDPDCPQCAAFLAYDPAYAYLPRRGHRLLRDAVELAVRARLSAAHHLLGVDGRTDDAITELSQAIATAAHAAMAVRTRQDVQRLVLGRVRSLTEAGGRSTRRLDAAVALLDAATPLVGRSGAADLNRAASKLRVDRALIRYNADRSADVSPLLPDIRDALDLHPDSVRGLDTLSRFVQLVNAAAPEYEQRERAARLVDVLERLHTAFAHAEASAALAATQDEILDSVKDLVFHWMSPREIADLLESYNDDPGDPRDLAERARGRSPERLDAIIRAIDDLVRALRLSPFDPDIRASLTEALTRLIDFLDRREGP